MNPLHTILSLPPPQLALGFKGGDDVLNAMTVRILVGVVGASRVTDEAFLLILKFEKKLLSNYEEKHIDLTSP